MNHRDTLIAGWLVVVTGVALAAPDSPSTQEQIAPPAIGADTPPPPIEARLAQGFTYQGRLRDAGVPANGAYPMSFRLYSQAAGGTLLQQVDVGNVQVSGGVFTVKLAFDPTHLDGSDRYLELHVDGTMLLPRQQLHPSPYAITADKLETPAFLANAANVLECESISGYAIQGRHLGNGTQAGVAGTTSSASSFAVGVLGQINLTTAGPDSAGVRGNNNGAEEHGFGVWGSHAGSGAGVYGSSPDGYGVFGKSTNDIGVRGHSDNAFGVYGDGALRGVWGQSSGGFGVYGGSASGIGVFATTFTSIGLRASATTGTGVWASTFDNIALIAERQSESIRAELAGNLAGAYGEDPRAAGIGVYGIAGSANPPRGGGAQDHPVGVFGTAEPYNGSFLASGVHGFANAGVEDDSVAYGVRGEAETNNTRQIAYGVYGAATGPGANLAGFFVGDVFITGNLAKGSGSFKIDHPLDPENKYLVHSFVESPDMMNIYNGVATFDEAGMAVVELPDYFQALNRDFRYQLTAMGAPMPNLFIAQEVVSNSFVIAGGEPGLRVSWEVTGVRQDAFANANRLINEVEKTGDEKGRLMHPEAFGSPWEEGIHGHRMAETRREQEAQSRRDR